MRRSEFWYTVGESDRRIRAFSDARIYEDQAEDAARDYHDHHGGSESIWPLTFILYETEDGPEQMRFIVEREMEPRFIPLPGSERANTEDS